MARVGGTGVDIVSWVFQWTGQPVMPITLPWHLCHVGHRADESSSQILTAVQDQPGAITTLIIKPRNNQCNLGRGALNSIINPGQDEGFGGVGRLTKIQAR